MTADAETLVILAPEFTTEPRERVEFFIEQARATISASVWGSLYDQGVLYMAAHLLTVSSSGGASGPISSETVGQLSRAYAVKSDGDEFDSTKYGRRYKELRATLAVSPIVV